VRFTIATFVHGETDIQDVAAGSPVHKVLEALTSWGENWQNRTLDSIALESATRVGSATDRLRPLPAASSPVLGNFYHGHLQFGAIRAPKACSPWLT